MKTSRIGKIPSPPAKLVHALARSAARRAASAFLTAGERTPSRLARLFVPAIAAGVIGFVFAPLFIAIAEVITPFHHGHDVGALVWKTAAIAAYVAIAFNTTIGAMLRTIRTAGAIGWLLALPVGLFVAAFFIAPPTRTIVFAWLVLYTTLHVVAFLSPVFPRARHRLRATAAGTSENVVFLAR